jgi:hypothetical protein
MPERNSVSFRRRAVARRPRFSLKAKKIYAAFFYQVLILTASSQVGSADLIKEAENFEKEFRSQNSEFRSQNQSVGDSDRAGIVRACVSKS